MDPNLLTQIQGIKERILEEEKNYSLALKENRGYSLLKGQRIILQELRLQLQAALERHRVENFLV
jgi:hypothetical protein